MSAAVTKLNCHPMSFSSSLIFWFVWYANFKRAEVLIYLQLRFLTRLSVLLYQTLRLLALTLILIMFFPFPHSSYHKRELTTAADEEQRPCLVGLMRCHLWRLAWLSAGSPTRWTAILHCRYLCLCRQHSEQSLTRAGARSLNTSNLSLKIRQNKMTPSPTFKWHGQLLIFKILSLGQFSAVCRHCCIKANPCSCLGVDVDTIFIFSGWRVRASFLRP